MGDYITTYTGKHFEPANPDSALICIEDIAHALPMICRGNGHVVTFWSVGEHCICCAREALARGLSNRLALACLLHDASECYMSDIPRPFKKHLPDYIRQEETLISMIYERFLGSDLTEIEQNQLKQIDDDLLWYDLRDLLKEPLMQDAPEIHIDMNYSFRPFEAVEKEYLTLYRQLSGME